ncbi:unnamed protein product, partial [Closterium sp. NIES-54]
SCVRSRIVGRTGTVRRTKESPPVIATLGLRRPRTAVLIRVCSRRVVKMARALRTRRGWHPVFVTLGLGWRRMARDAQADTCVLQACAGKSHCAKDAEGAASCVCDYGFGLAADGKTCTDTCVLQACAGKGHCAKDAEGAASCVCDHGFGLAADGKTCTDTCVLQACAGKGHCAKDAEGAASCVCDHGFGLAEDGKTCTEACILRACSANGHCVKDNLGLASCVCDIGFALERDGRTCTGKEGCCVVRMLCSKDAFHALSPRPSLSNVSFCVPLPLPLPLRLPLLHPSLLLTLSRSRPATCGNCPAKATCTLVSATKKAPYCVCPRGYGMTSNGCFNRAIPTVSSASFTFYASSNYKFSSHTMRLNYNACTNVPRTIGSHFRSYWRVDHAPGGAGDCKIIYVYGSANCNGSPTKLHSLYATRITAAGVP